MATKEINKSTLKDVVEELINGEFIYLGVGYELTMECEDKSNETDEQDKVLLRFNIFDAMGGYNNISVVPKSTCTDSLWSREEKIPLSLFSRRKFILDTLVEIMDKVFPELLKQRINESKEHIRDVKSQKTLWKKVSKELINDSKIWGDD